MIKYEFGVMCESAIVDQQTNQISLIKIIEGMNFAALPGVIPNAHLVTIWSKTKNLKKAQSAEAKFTLVPSNQSEDETHPTINFAIEMPADKKTMRLIMEVFGTPITRTGEHAFILEVKEHDDWVKVGEIKFDATNDPLPANVVGLPKRD